MPKKKFPLSLSILMAFTLFTCKPVYANEKNDWLKPTASKSCAFLLIGILGIPFVLAASGVQCNRTSVLDDPLLERKIAGAKAQNSHRNLWVTESKLEELKNKDTAALLENVFQKSESWEEYLSEFFIFMELNTESRDACMANAKKFAEAAKIDFSKYKPTNSKTANELNTLVIEYTLKKAAYDGNVALADSIQTSTVAMKARHPFLSLFFGWSLFRADKKELSQLKKEDAKLLRELNDDDRKATLILEKDINLRKRKK